MDVSDRLSQLRKLMAAENIDTYIVTKSDPHQSEDSPEFWNSVKFISGFSGSAGVVVVTRNQAGLWTDGRYYIQAEKELKGSGIDLYRAAEPETKDFLTFAKDETPENGHIGFDGRTLSMTQVEKLLTMIKHKKIALKTEVELIGDIWDDRPAISVSPVYDFDISFCGVPRMEKIKALRERMRVNGADMVVISSTDDIAWLFNLRGNDLPLHTCFASFAAVDMQNARVFIHEEKSKDVKELLAHDGVIVEAYEAIYDFLSQYKQANGDEANVFVNPATTCYAVYKTMESLSITELPADYTTEMKAVKNDVELANLEKVNVRDGVAMVRFIKWVKENAHLGTVTECDIDEKLLELRSEGENFVFPSFGTIAAYMSNAAMMHYHAKDGDCAVIKADGMLLVDSGGHYSDGTTDITRTIALGALSTQMIRDFTLTLQSHIDLAATVFLYGSAGCNLDVIARRPMWENGLDYKCGTGHGLGFFLNVHEGPHGIRPAANPAKLEIGMIMTNEPGVYRQNEYGIRTENTMKVIPHSETPFGKFLAFSVFSYCPIDLAAVDVSMLSEKQRQWLNNYHQTVYDKLSPHLSEKDAAWLRHETRAI